MLTFEAVQDGRSWSAECVELGVASCGDSEKEAIANAKEATLLYLEEKRRADGPDWDMTIEWVLLKYEDVWKALA